MSQAETVVSTAPLAPTRRRLAEGFVVGAWQAGPCEARGALCDLFAAWPRGSDGSWTIGVCWENPGYQYASEMQLVQQQIEQTWQRHSQIKFEGWGPCKPESLGIRIHVSDGQLLGQKQSTTLIDDRKGDVAVELDAELPSQAIAYGRFLDGIANGLILELGPPQTASSPRQRCMRVFANRGQSMAKSRELCIRYEASHMFGHALGLRHPRNEREPFNAPETEATGGCTSLSAAGAASDTGEAPAAVRSVISRPAKAGSFMSKCAPPENVGELSHSDIVLIMSVYGRDCNAAVNPNCLRQGARE